MAPFLLLLNATKLLGAAGVVAVVLDAIAYRSFRKGNLLPFVSPIDEDEEVLAKFAIDKDVDDGGFFFALATAPAHVEDKLQDAWLEFAAAEEVKKQESKAASRASSLGDAELIDGLDDTKDDDKTEDESLVDTSEVISSNDPRQAAKDLILRTIEKVSNKIDEAGEAGANVAAWQNAYHPEQRLRFWSEPETELELAKNANVKVFRMGVDWSRIMPIEPVNGIEVDLKWDAVQRYREIIESVRAKDMRVMLTLFHHSLPVWAADFGGWKNPKTVKYFVEFTKVVVERYADLVDYWITFNEPHVFTLLTYCAGAWPGGNTSIIETATAIMPNGVFRVVMRAMADAHGQAYDIIHAKRNKLSRRAKVGVAHHVSFMRPYGLFDVPVAMFSDLMTRFSFLDDTVKKLDYIGINYYGQEVVHLPGLKHVETDEYSESGRGVYPDGLFRVLISFHNRYKKFNVPFIITENGVSDSTDYIRRPYITEHLLAIQAAIIQGVPVQGYCFWTTSDNWEWADGYGPKFGLVAVDRHHDLARTPRPSYHLYSEISKTGMVTKKQRNDAWEELQAAVQKGVQRPFCRQIDNHGLMYSSGLDVPIDIPLAHRDWRFGHYEMEGLQDPLSRFIRFILTGAFFGRKKRPHTRRPPKEPETKGVLADPVTKEATEKSLATA